MLDKPFVTTPKDSSEVVPELRAAGDSEVPETLTLPLPPGVAEKLMLPLRAPLTLGVNMMCTVHEAPAAKVVTHDTQSVPVGLWMTNSLLLEVRQIAPLPSWPVFVMVKL